MQLDASYTINYAMLFYFAADYLGHPKTTQCLFFLQSCASKPKSIRRFLQADFVVWASRYDREANYYLTNVHLKRN